MMKGIPHRRTDYGSVDHTVIAIEAEESTPLLVDRWPGNSYNTSNSHNTSNSYNTSTKSFKSHFLEWKVLAFAIMVAIGISVATYLLLIQSRLPPITLSLYLVSHDIWSSKIISERYHALQHNIIDHIIVMQTGTRNCSTSEECLEILREMQNNETEELPFNFLIGGDLHTYEVRGWKYQSGTKGVPQKQSLVIGIIGNFDQSPPKNKLIRSVKSLIRLSLKRQLINTNYYIYGLIRSEKDRNEGQQLFNQIKKWPKFKDVLTSY